MRVTMSIESQVANFSSKSWSRRTITRSHSGLCSLGPTNAMSETTATTNLSESSTCDRQHAGFDKLMTTRTHEILHFWARDLANSTSSCCSGYGRHRFRRMTALAQFSTSMSFCRSSWKDHAWTAVWTEDRQCLHAAAAAIAVFDHCAVGMDC